MSIITHSNLGKVTAAVVGISVAVAVLIGAAAVPAQAQAALTEAQIQSILTLLSSFGTDQATIDNVNSALRGQPTGGTSGGTGTGYVFNTNLKQGDTGEDARQLQIALNRLSCCNVAGSGAGSPGGETAFFGSLTKAAVVKFQNTYASDVLTPLGLSSGTGFFGPSSRAKLNDLMVSTGTTTPPPVTPPPTTPPPVGTYEGNVSVFAGSTQPANGSAPKNAARVPFTNVTFTAGPTGATIDSITVERMGVSANTDVSGVVLLDENGVQLGLEKTLNSDNTTKLTEDFSIAPNTSRTMTIGANMPASPGAGNILILAVNEVVAVNGTVTGSLPITGAAHTVNTSTTIGSVTVTALSHSNATKDIGTEGYVFSSFRLTAGSAEKIKLSSIKWNMTGSAGKDDLVNVKTVIDGVDYPTTVSSDGKFYSSAINNVIIDKGNSVEIKVKGDIVDGSGRTVIFDIHKKTDVNISGETFKFGITPPAGSGTAATTNNVFTAGTPWLDGPTITVGGGSISVSNAVTVNAQNVSENVNGEPMGGFKVETKGENITVGKLVFNITLGSDVAATGVNDLTNVTLVKKSSGATVAGPVDGANVTTSGSSGTVTFTDTVTFMPGTEVYELRGKYGTDFVNNMTVTASTTPSSDWTTVTGQTTGDNITPSPSTGVTANAMTVKSASVTLSVGTTPVAQTVVAGGSFAFANYELDTTQSGDAIRMSSLPLEYGGTGLATNLFNCKLFNGATDLSGSNKVDPSAFASSTTFTFTNPQVFPKGVVTTLALMCETKATTTGTSYRWGYDSASSPSATAEGSGETVTVTENDSAGQLITLATGGTYDVTDDSTPGYRIVTPGTQVDLLKLKFSAQQEDIDIARVALQLTSAASNTPDNLVGRTVTLWDGTTQVGTAVFSNSGVTADYATSTAIASGAFRVSKDSSKTMTVKGTINTICTSCGNIRSGDLLIVSWDAHAAGLANGNYAVGVSGGTNISPTTAADVSPTGVRLMKSYPTLSRVTLNSSDTLLQTGSARKLYRFKVSTNGGEVAFYKFTFNVGSSTKKATTTKFSLYAYTDAAFGNADTSFSSNGLLNAGQCFNGNSATRVALAAATSNHSGAGNSGDVEIYPDKTSCNTATTTYRFTTDRYFQLEATVSNVETAAGVETMEVSLLGDAAYPVNSTTLMSKPGAGDTNGVDADTNDDLIWSPRSTSTSASIDDLDWTNGYQVPSLPTTNMASEIFTSAN